MFDRRLLRNFDWLLFFTVCAIFMVSVIIISSTTANLTGDPHYYVKRQLIRFVMGFVAMLFIMSIDYTQLYRFAPYLYVLNLVLLIAVIFAGKDGGGAQRWIDLKFFDLQP